MFSLILLNYNTIPIYMLTRLICLCIISSCIMYDNDKKIYYKNNKSLIAKTCAIIDNTHNISRTNNFILKKLLEDIVKNIIINII